MTDILKEKFTEEQLDQIKEDLVNIILDEYAGENIADFPILLFAFSYVSGELATDTILLAEIKNDKEFLEDLGYKIMEKYNGLFFPYVIAICTQSELKTKEDDENSFDTIVASYLTIDGRGDTSVIVLKNEKISSKLDMKEKKAIFQLEYIYDGIRSFIAENMI